MEKKQLGGGQEGATEASGLQEGPRVLLSWEGDSTALQRVVEVLPDPIFVKDLSHRWVAFNDAFCRVLGKRREELLGKSDFDIFPHDRAARNWQIDDDLFATGEPTSNETVIVSKDGHERTVWTRKYPLRDAAGRIQGLCAHTTDITYVKEQLQEAERAEAQVREQRAVIEVQQQLIAELAVPVIEVWDKILLLPLIGTLSPGRAEQAMEALLGAVSRRGAEMAIIDVTGVPMVDAPVAELLVRAVRAVGLLGCRSILAGIGSFSARALVDGGVDLGTVTTVATLKHGIVHALKSR